MTSFFTHQAPPFVLTTDVAAHQFMGADAEMQASFLKQMAWLIADWGHEMNWAQQCRFIAQEMDDFQCGAVRVMLETLVEHLEAIPRERRAAGITDNICGAVAAALKE